MDKNHLHDGYPVLKLKSSLRSGVKHVQATPGHNARSATNTSTPSSEVRLLFRKYIVWVLFTSGFILDQKRKPFSLFTLDFKFKCRLSLCVRLYYQVPGCFFMLLQTMRDTLVLWQTHLSLYQVFEIPIFDRWCEDDCGRNVNWR